MRKGAGAEDVFGLCRNSLQILSQLRHGQGKRSLRGSRRNAPKALETNSLDKVRLILHHSTPHQSGREAPRPRIPPPRLAERAQRQMCFVLISRRFAFAAARRQQRLAIAGGRGAREVAAGDSPPRALRWDTSRSGWKARGKPPPCPSGVHDRLRLCASPRSINLRRRGATRNMDQYVIGTLLLPLISTIAFRPAVGLAHRLGEIPALESNGRSKRMEIQTGRKLFSPQAALDALL